MSTSASEATTASTSTFVTALVFNAIVFGAEIAAFTILRPRFKFIYEARSFHPNPSKRTNAFPGNILLWPWTVLMAPYDDIRRVNGLDAYFFVRFLRMIVRVFLPIWIISWIILLPITSAGTAVSGHSGLDRFILGNVDDNHQARYWAHLILTWLFTIWLYWNIRYEMRHFVTARQHYLVDPEHSASAQANTILITGVPKKYLSERALKQLFSYLPGGVRKVWLNRDLKDLPDMYDNRLKACAKLESAETSLLNTATKLRNKQLKKDAKAAKKNNGGSDAKPAEPRMSDGQPLTEPSVRSDVDTERGEVPLAEKLVPEKKRPTHRLPIGPLPFSLPLVGKKVDTIEWSREEIVRLSQELAKGRRALSHDIAFTSNSPPQSVNATPETGDGQDGKDKDGRTYAPLNSAFILFNHQIAAHLAAQALVHHEPYRMADKYTEVSPEDVIWGNLGLNPYEKSVRKIVSWAATVGLIILWAFPVAFVGIVSNVSTLCETASWLAWLCKLPSPIEGIISGILPPVALAILMMLLPIVLRLLARFEGIPKYSGLELSLMTRYFMFQVIHSFLIVTLSSGIIAALPSLINDPTSIPSLLAKNLPSASNFFLTYVILQGLSGTASSFLQAVPLVLYYVKLFILGSTPRSVYKIKHGARGVAWGTLFPAITLLVVVALAYMIISPIINGLTVASFFLFYLLYKYLFLWVFEQPQSRETGGLYFPKAIQHIFVGMYIQQICLCALFFLARDDSDKASAIPEGALMIVLIVFTAFFHYTINNSYNPIRYSLPLTLTDRTYGTRPQDQTEVVQTSGASIGEKQPLKRNKMVEQFDNSGDENPKRQVSESVVESQEAEAGNAAAVQRHDSTDSNDNDEGPKEFDHPASVEPQRAIWISVDELGLGEAEAEALRVLGIDVSMDGAKMDGKGHVDVTKPPPDELLKE